MFRGLLTCAERAACAERAERAAQCSYIYIYIYMGMALDQRILLQTEVSIMGQALAWAGAQAVLV